jgi:hypothetical protein
MFMGTSNNKVQPTPFLVWLICSLATYWPQRHPIFISHRCSRRSQHMPRQGKAVG